ncbi:uncharacterized protein [Euphorbia lathyris]|uniref:uncharacterized protein isoform X2 n=1 Tax=Euphorbia lathyris TaxID=212925 RepID=UPI00331369FC
MILVSLPVDLASSVHLFMAFLNSRSVKKRKQLVKSSVMVTAGANQVSLGLKRIRYCKRCKACVKGFDGHCSAFRNCIARNERESVQIAMRPKVSWSSSGSAGVVQIQCTDLTSAFGDWFCRVVPVLGVPDALVPLDHPVSQLNLVPRCQRKEVQEKREQRDGRKHAKNGHNKSGGSRFRCLGFLYS